LDVILGRLLTSGDLIGLLQARPFAPFRLHLGDGGSADVRSPEVVSVGRRFALVGLLDPSATDTLFDRWAVVWYMHVTRVEMLDAGPPPLDPPPAGPAEAPSPAPA
jgi:hypothetical protein